jgi:hypothetical protein
LRIEADVEFARKNAWIWKSFGASARTRSIPRCFRPPAALSVGTRIDLQAPLNGEATCLVRYMVAAEPEGAPTGFALPSGAVKFLAFTGATSAEVEFARQKSSAKLIEALRAAGHHPVTNPRRPSLY